MRLGKIITLSALMPPMFAIMLFSAAGSAAAPPRIGAPTSGPAVPTDAMRVQLAQVTIEQRVIIRIPAISMPAVPTESRNATIAPPIPPMPARPDIAREVKGPKCLKLGQIRGALINLDSGITMVTDQNEQFRAHFGRSCRAADFYAGFYIEPNKDGTICAGRDMLHARNGSNCNIEKFSKLVPDD